MIQTTSEETVDSKVCVLIVHLFWQYIVAIFLHVFI
jgi:hypothetical protein